MVVDWVRCCNCGKESYVELGGNICPHCHTEGTLTWASDNPDEHEVEGYPTLNPPSCAR